MKTILSVLKTILLFLLLICFIFISLALLGYLYVKVVNLIDQQLLRYLFTVVYFIAMVTLVLRIGKKAMNSLLNRD